MKNFTVTVIIPAYNAGQTIEKCLKSILGQSYRNLEIIVVDDGSTDETYNICKSLEKVDSRLIVIRQENAGPSAARNQGIDISNGQYIMFVDSDDWIEQDNISYVVSKAEETDADIVLWNLYFDTNGISKKNQPLKGDNRLFSRDEIKKLMILLLTYVSENENMSNLSITGPVCKLFKREVIGKSRFPINQRLGEDLVLLMDVLCEVNNVVYVNKCFYHVNVRNDSLSHSFNPSYSDWKADFVNAVMVRIRNNDDYNNVADKFVYNNYLTVVEQCLFFSGNIKYSEKRKSILKFLHGIDYKIDYSNLSHKCAFFLKHKLFFPIYMIGILSGRYSE